MKNSSLGTKTLMALVCLAVLFYFGLQAYRYFDDPLTTTASYTYQVEKDLSLSGYVVRDEKVLPDSTDGLLRFSRSEGERVSVGGEIAVVYADQASLDRQDEIDSLQTQIEQLEFAQQAALGSEVSLKLDSQITAAMLALRSDVTADKLDAAEDHISNLRSLVLKRDYTYTDTDDLTGQITDLESQLKTLKAQAASGTRTITAPTAGLFSAVVDGYETVLTPEALDGLTPSALASVKADGTVSSNVGKLILGDTWYYAATLSESDAGKLTVGQTQTLRFNKGEEQDYQVKVQSLSTAEDGRVAAVFSCNYYLPELTLLRQQSAELVLETVTGIRVPKEALRVDADGQSGLYCVVGMVAQFKPVNVLYTGEDFVLVSGAAQTEKSRLRPGDEVIISARDLYDGKVVR